MKVFEEIKAGKFDMGGMISAASTKEEVVQALAVRVADVVTSFQAEIVQRDPSMTHAAVDRIFNLVSAAEAATGPDVREGLGDVASLVDAVGRTTLFNLCERATAMMEFINLGMNSPRVAALVSKIQGGAYVNSPGFESDVLGVLGLQDHFSLTAAVYLAVNSRAIRNIHLATDPEQHCKTSLTEAVNDFLPYMREHVTSLVYTGEKSTCAPS